MRVIILLAVLLQISLAYKILVFNLKFGHSHVNYLSAIADILAEAGHDVTTLMSDLDPAMQNVTKRSRIVIIPPDEEANRDLYREMRNGFDPFTLETRGWPSAIITGMSLGKIFGKQCRKSMQMTTLLRELRDEHYDVMITENFEFCGIGLSHLIQPKAVITVSSCSIFDLTALQLGLPLGITYNPVHPSYDVTSLVQRAFSVYERLREQIFLRIHMYYAQRAFREEFGPDFPDLGDLTSRSAFHFTNSEPLIDFARPVLKKIVDLGGLSIQDAKPLDKYWDNILSLRPRSVLLSFGSVMKSSRLLPKYKSAILKTFARFPNVTFIWKYELDDDFAVNDASKVENIVLSKWTPQSDLLGDPRLTAFITHAGMGSTQETAARGVPALLIPLFGDQFRNAALLENVGVGIAFDKYKMADADEFTKSVRKLLETPSLRENGRRISHMLANRPYAPKDLLLRHVEFAARFGPVENMTPKGVQLSFVQYYFLDILAILALSLTVISYGIIRILKMLVQSCVRPEKAKMS